MGPELQFNRFSHSVRHALCGAAYLAENYGEYYCQVEEVAASEKLPADFLSKIFQKLAHQGVLFSRRGVHGGYRLVQSPDKISLAQIVEAAEEGSESARNCLLEVKNCSSKSHCIIHNDVVRSEKVLRDALSRVTLGDLVKDIKKSGRLKQVRR